MAAIIEVKYFNSFWLKKTVDAESIPVWSGSFGIPTGIGGFPIAGGDANPAENWEIEEARIQGGYNNTTVDFGVKAYITEDDTIASIKGSTLIYSGVFNSRTGVNNTNQFSTGEDITKGLDPANGTIQKLYAEDTNLIIFQENKVSRVLVDKSAVYSAEGGGSLTSTNLVLGQIVAYGGNYGISRDPRSFAVFGYRKYFTDRDRNAVCRLSQDGITEISEYGMNDFFREGFVDIDSASYGNGKIIGGWDVYNRQYVVSLQKSATNPDQSYSTLSFDEQAGGWTSFFSFNPSQFLSLKNKVYSLNSGTLYLHYSPTAKRGDFYGSNYPSTVTFIFNEDPSLIKNFKTIKYEGTNGWQVNFFVSDFTGPDYSGGVPVYFQDQVGSPYVSATTPPAILSYLEGSYDNYGHSFPQPLLPPINRAGFDRKENKYMTNLVNNSLPNPGEISYGIDVTGIKGYFAVVTMSTDNVTDVGSAKELFAVGTDYDASSY